jgi:hypothetical protein
LSKYYCYNTLKLHKDPFVSVIIQSYEEIIYGLFSRVVLYGRRWHLTDLIVS